MGRAIILENSILKNGSPNFTVKAKFGGLKFYYLLNIDAPIGFSPTIPEQGQL